MSKLSIIVGNQKLCSKIYTLLCIYFYKVLVHILVLVHICFTELKGSDLEFICFLVLILIPFGHNIHQVIHITTNIGIYGLNQMNLSTNHISVQIVFNARKLQ